MKIRYGLSAIRGLSAATTDGLLRERGIRPFSSMADLLRRVAVNKRDLTALVGSGACDGLLAADGIGRADALASAEAWCKWARKERKRAAGGQMSLFGS